MSAPFKPGDRVIALGEIPETVTAVDEWGAELAGGGYAVWSELQPAPGAPALRVVSGREGAP